MNSFVSFLSESVSRTVPAASELSTEGRPLGGSTGARLHSHKADGSLWVVKAGAGPEHARNEHLANRIYRALGVPVAQSHLDESDPRKPLHIAAYIRGKHLAEHPDLVHEVSKHFAADALLANWDVTGYDDDNIVVDSSKIPHRIDNGGALGFRAMGDRKPFTGHVGELDSMRSSRSGVRWFGHLSDSDIASQIHEILPRTHAVLDSIQNQQTRNIISSRLDYMKKWAAEKGKS